MRYPIIHIEYIEVMYRTLQYIWVGIYVTEPIRIMAIITIDIDLIRISTNIQGSTLVLMHIKENDPILHDNDQIITKLELKLNWKKIQAKR